MRPMNTRPASRACGGSTAVSPSRISLSRTILVSIQCYVLRFYDLRPSRAVGVNEFRDRGRVAGTEHGKSDLFQRGAKCVVIQGAVEAGADLLCNVFRQFGGCRDAVPDTDDVIGIAALRNG